ncbi:MAG: (d)CMP kinase [Wenzhouxiangellaceae bacterium]
MAVIPVITIDGPSAVGKGTAARLVAAELGFHLLDSGALYRLLALKTLRLGMPQVAANAAQIASLAEQLDIAFEADDGNTRVLLDGEDVSAEIRTEAVGARASEVAALADVRAALLDLQRGFRRAPGLVADGRDMGTVVFPDAQVKLFIDASAAVRARRRHKELSDKGKNVNIASLLREINERDDRDRNRKVAPLQPAADALLINTDELGIQQVKSQIIDHIRQCLPDQPLPGSTDC